MRAPPVPDDARVPRRLRAPAPGWTVEADVVVIGSGIAGLTAALRASETRSVQVVTKDILSAGSTRWAQEGIAAAVGRGDSPGQHFADTLAAGAGLCDAAAVRTLVTEGPAAVRELIDIGTRFDRSQDGALALAREGGHHRHRVVRAGGDATGAEIQRALVAEEEPPPWRLPVKQEQTHADPGLVDPDVVAALQQRMTEEAGVLRTACGLADATKTVAELARDTGSAPGTEAWEATNLVT
ncbi:MAG: FAD-dependent oxidoreductase, partial [Actinomycetota bacterium]|nr:FAD-dependent oxidoreductase [Actinomycetota bacterium]